jgi:hypothetical protein
VVVTPIEKGDADRPASARAAYSPPKPPPTTATCGRLATSGTAEERLELRRPGRLFPHHYARVFWRTNACTRFQASAEASANAVCFRSKKLCGAPG